MNRDLRQCMIPAALVLALAAQAQPGSIDTGFAASVQTGGGANGPVSCTATDADGNVYVGGAFTQFSGASANRFAKLLIDGTLDATFTATVDLVGNDVKAVAVQSDGKILIGGNFSSVGGTPRQYIARLNADGTLDAAFAPAINLPVFCIALQPDGAILAGGQFFFNPGFTRRGIIRLLPNGTSDPGFDPGSGANGTVHAVDVAANGLIAIAGAFTDFNGVAANHIALLGSNGALHAGFTPVSGLDGNAYAVHVLADGRILVGGEFDQFDGNPNPAMVCLTQAGALDPGFAINGFSASAAVLAIQSDMNGLAVVCGTFSSFGAQPRNRLLRLLGDGSLDPDFAVGTGITGSVAASLTTDPAGRIIVGGIFIAYQGITQNGITRIFSCQQTLYYRDDDGDGFGDPLLPLAACAAPVSHVLDNTDCDDTDALILGPATWYRDIDEDGTGDPAISLVSCSEPTGYTLNNIDCDDADPDIFQGAECDDGDPTTVEDHINQSCVCIGGAIDVAVKVFLDGPFNGSDMNDGLRAAGLVPLTEPYTGLNFHPAEPGGGEVIDPAVLTVTGPDAIVDWVMLALRTDYDPTLRKNIRMALLQKDGDVVDLDGISPVRFSEVPDAFFVEVRHRNHLGIMSAAPLPEVPTGTLVGIDFTAPGTACYGTNARKQSGSTMRMWAGNTIANGILSYTGSGNDRDKILVAVGSTTPNGTLIGYRVEDVNLNGTVSYTGSSNDRDPILVNVGNTTPNAVRMEQLP